MWTGFTHDRLAIGDVRISYWKAGSGPPVLLLHGFPQCAALWARVAPRLAERYTVVCADLRGYGQSDKPEDSPDHSAYSFRQMAADQRALMAALGFARFHAIGHDRGGRTLHRLALDNPEAVLSLAVLDIVPTTAMFLETNRHIAHAYWHWYFLAQPAPFPERLIGSDPDFFYETCLLGWGATRIGDFDAEQLAAYRSAWRDPDMISGSCADYRAAASIDLEHDLADLAVKVQCPTLVLYGADGVMGKLYDLPAQWAKRLANMHARALPGGHFFIDSHPAETASALLEHLDRSCAAI